MAASDQSTSSKPGDATPSTAAAAVDDQTDEEKVTCLACSFCRFPLASVAQVLVEKTACWEAEVYAYPLAILDLDEVWSYSATNPSKRRFDVVRTLSTPGVTTCGTPTALHSWFPAYSWNMASCSSCGEHLGWGFVLNPAQPDPAEGQEQQQQAAEDQGGDSDSVSDDDEEEEGEEDVQWASPFAPHVAIDFQGLISTKCCERTFSKAEYEGLVTPSNVANVKAKLASYLVKMQQCYVVLSSLEDRRLANELGMLLYLMKNEDFSLRDSIDSLHSQLFGSL